MKVYFRLYSLFLYSVYISCKPTLSLGDKNPVSNQNLEILIIILPDCLSNRNEGIAPLRQNQLFQSNT